MDGKKTIYFSLPCYNVQDNVVLPAEDIMAILSDSRVIPNYNGCGLYDNCFSLGW